MIDSNFAVALMDQNDAFHEDAVFVFDEILRYKAFVKFIIPSISLYEIITTLRRKGFDQPVIQERVMKFLGLDEVIVASMGEMVAFRHCGNILNQKDQSKSLRTHDFMIASIAIDYEAQILTFDKIMRNKIKPVYSKIYDCSDGKENDNDVIKFFEDFYLAAKTGN